MTANLIISLTIEIQYKMPRRSKRFNQVHAAPLQNIHDFHLQNVLRDDPNLVKTSNSYDG